MTVREDIHSLKSKDFPGSAQTREEANFWGKSLRNKLSRTTHAGWYPPIDRPDPIDLLIETNKDRQSHLIPVRYGRMLQSPFAFFRGAAAIMANDLATTPRTGLYVQACGDCHLMNFGTYATPERRIVFDINDFDETLPAPWEWDIKRLTTSFIIGSIQNSIDYTEAKNIARECALSYREHMAQYAVMTPLEIWFSSISIEDILELVKSDETKKRINKQVEKAKDKSLIGEDYPKFIEMKDGRILIKDNPPFIFHRTGIDEKEYRRLVDEVFEHYYETLGDEKKMLLEQFKYMDIAAKVAGVASVGTLCGISLRMTVDKEPLFLQVKEARASVLEQYAGKSRYENRAQRVVSGQKLMQAVPDLFLGWAASSTGRHFYIRQLRDMKIKPMVEIFDDKHMLGYARLCGWTLARAHARSGKAAIISGYLGNAPKFDEAVADFAFEYAGQNEKDYSALQEAVRLGRVEAYFER